MLENHTDFLSLFVDIDTQIRQIDPVIQNLTGGRILHTVQTAKQCAFPGTGWPDNHYFFALFNGEVYPL